MVKNQPANAGDIRDVGLIPGLGRSPGGGHGNPLQYPFLGIPWTEEPGGVLRVAKSRTLLKRLSMHARKLFSVVTLSFSCFFVVVFPSR